MIPIFVLTLKVCKRKIIKKRLNDGLNLKLSMELMGKIKRITTLENNYNKKLNLY